ncbi:uncharacterized protein METZ01_LOCUS404538 [marine metagenome]|uniref:Uncharacterized protein n=1 Tax=marine metagenome TaxID=408172 RepID=A0A382VZ08_9ZZZZ
MGDLRPIGTVIPPLYPDTTVVI